METNPPSEPKNVVRRFECPKCKKMHVVKFPANFADNRDTYPFPFVYLHSSIEDLQDLLTILYIDRNLQIRGSDVFRVEGGDIFSEGLAKKISEKLMEEIIALQTENSELEEENQQLQVLLEKGEIANYIQVEAESIKKSFKSSNEQSELETNSEIEEKSANNVQSNENIVKSESIEPQISYSPILVEPSGSMITTPESIKEEVSDLIDVSFESLICSIPKFTTLSFSKSWKVYEVKSAIGEQLNIIPASFFLSYGGVLMDDFKSFEEYHVTSGKVLCLIPNTTGG